MNIHGKMVTFAFSFAHLPLFLFLVLDVFHHVWSSCNINCFQPARGDVTSQGPTCHFFQSLGSNCTSWYEQWLRVWGMLWCSDYHSLQLPIGWCFPHCFSLLFVWLPLDASPSSQNRVQCPPNTASTNQEPLNLSSRHRPRSPLHKANGRIPGKR